LSESKYTRDLLSRAGMLSCKAVTMSLSPTAKLSVNEGTPLASDDATKYQSFVGALHYLTLIWPEISYSVNKVCQYFHTSMTEHLTAVKHILHFLENTQGLNIRQFSSTTVSAFSEADWAGCTDDRKFTKGFAVFLGLNLISWCAKK
jgi:hypothetical protein